MFLFVAWSCALRASAAPTDLPEPYLALFTFQRAELGTITDDQLRILEASPFDGMAVWCLDCRSTETPPALAELGPRLEHLRNNTTKHVWPVAFLNRIIEQTPETTPPGQADPDPEFAKIRGLDLDDEAGALSAFLLSWRLSLQIARELGAPGVCLDPEFYNDHALENIARLAQRRGERDSETLAKLRAVGARMADIVGEEYPGAVVWTLFTRLCGPSGWINGAPGHLLKAFLDRANETSIPLALVDGAEESTSIGYVNPSLVALEEKIDAYESRYQGARAVGWSPAQERYAPELKRPSDCDAGSGVICLVGGALSE